jgi:hypothetical protein
MGAERKPLCALGGDQRQLLEVTPSQSGVKPCRIWFACSLVIQYQRGCQIA